VQHIGKADAVTVCGVIHCTWATAPEEAIYNQIVLESRSSFYTVPQLIFVMQLGEYEFPPFIDEETARQLTCPRLYRE